MDWEARIVQEFMNSRPGSALFPLPKKTYEQVIELKDVLIARQQSEKQSDVSKYTRWQQLKVGLLSVKHQNININCKNRNEILRQPR